MAKTFYQTFFKTCAKEDLTLWECPNFIFSLMGGVTIGVMIAAYYVSILYLRIEWVSMIVIVTAATFLILSYTVSHSIQRLGNARRIAEREKSKTEAIIENLADGLVMLDPKCRVALVNPRAEEYLGIKEKDVLGIDVGKKNNAPNLDMFCKVVHWCPTGSERINNKAFQETFAITHPRQRFIHTHASQAIDNRGNLIGFVTIVRDITREKALDEVKSDFISIASHQLKTPLSIMKWNLEILKKGYAGNASSEQHTIIDQVDKANDDLISLVEDLLDVSKIEEGKTKPVVTQSSIISVVNKVIIQYQMLANKRNVKLVAKLPSKDIRFYFDPRAIGIVVSNLVDNAIKYTLGHGSVTVTVEFQPPDHQNDVRVSIKDTGVGMKEEEKEKLFAKFGRGKNIEKISTRGTGLGLYIAKSIVEMHDGKVDVSSIPGKGSTFSFTIPLKLTKPKK
ncbi:sensor histidine kinase [Patescibacteria group bacterium]